MFSLFSKNCCFWFLFNDVVGGNGNELVGGGRIGDKGSCTVQYCTVGG